MNSRLLREHDIDGVKVLGVDLNELPVGTELSVITEADLTSWGELNRRPYLIEKREDGLYILLPTQIYPINTDPKKCQQLYAYRSGGPEHDYTISENFIGIGMHIGYLVPDLMHPESTMSSQTASVIEIQIR
jgi:hypothetical protein